MILLSVMGCNCKLGFINLNVPEKCIRVCKIAKMISDILFIFHDSLDGHATTPHCTHLYYMYYVKKVEVPRSVVK